MCRLLLPLLLLLLLLETGISSLDMECKFAGAD